MGRAVALTGPAVPGREARPHPSSYEDGEEAAARDELGEPRVLAALGASSPSSAEARRASPRQTTIRASSRPAAATRQSRSRPGQPSNPPPSPPPRARPGRWRGGRRGKPARRRGWPSVGPSRTSTLPPSGGRPARTEEASTGSVGASVAEASGRPSERPPTAMPAMASGITIARSRQATCRQRHDAGRSMAKPAPARETMPMRSATCSATRRSQLAPGGSIQAGAAGVSAGAAPAST